MLRYYGLNYQYSADYRSYISANNVRVAALTQAMSARARASELPKLPDKMADGRSHLEYFRTHLKKKIQLVIFGRHSRDWLEALAPDSPVWSGSELIGNVVHARGTSNDLRRKASPDYYQIALPLMEKHARAMPNTVANFSVEPEQMEILADKGLFAAYMNQRKFTRWVPELYNAFDDVVFPCVFKCTRRNGGQGIYRVSDRVQLEGLARSTLRARETFILQAWVGGSNEYVTHAVFHNGRMIWHRTFEHQLASEYSIRDAHFTGICDSLRVDTPPALMKALDSIAGDLNLSGPVNIDYKMTDGQPLIFEINPRLGGSLMRPVNADLLKEVLTVVTEQAAATDLFFAQIIRRSKFFDARAYIKPPHEFQHRPQDAALHYFSAGAPEGRDPGPFFSTRDYMAMNLGQAEAGLNPLVHFELIGIAENLPIRSAARQAVMSAMRSLDRIEPAGTILAGAPARRRSVFVTQGRPILAHEDTPRGLHKIFYGLKHILGLNTDNIGLTPNEVLKPEARSGRSVLSKLTAAEAQKYIQDLNLKPVGNTWHYSWDLERFFPELYLLETPAQSYLFHPKPIPYISAPAPLFSTDRELNTIIAHTGRYFPYWFLHYHGFDAFLERRSEFSANSTSNFPTRQTYRRFMNKKGGVIERLPLMANMDMFIEQFSALKPAGFAFNGEACVRFYFKANPDVPRDWFYVYRLIDPVRNEGLGVMLTIEDGRSAAMLNLASQRGYGLITIVEAFRLMEHLNYSSINAGVSGIYGHYKSKLFMDMMRTDASGLPPLCIK